MNNAPKNPQALQLNSLEIKRNMYKFAYDNIPAGALAGKISYWDKLPAMEQLVEKITSKSERYTSCCG